MSLRASQSILRNTVDGRHPANHLGCVKPCQWWDKLPVNWVDRCRISCNSITIQYLYIYILYMWYVYDGSGSQSPWQCWNESTVSERFPALSMGFGPLSLHRIKVQRYFSKLNFQLWRHHHFVFFREKSCTNPTKDGESYILSHPSGKTDLPLSVAPPLHVFFYLGQQDEAWAPSIYVVFGQLMLKLVVWGPLVWIPLRSPYERHWKALLLGGAPSKPQITNPSHQLTPPKTNCWFRTKPLRNE